MHVNSNVAVGHDTVLEEYATLLPGCNIAGSVRIGRAATIGAGATVIDGITVGAGAMVGAGSGCHPGRTRGRRGRRGARPSVGAGSRFGTNDFESVTVHTEVQSLTKVALITGITGQDGSYLSELLLDKGYVVHGVKRRSSSFNTERIDRIDRHPRDPEARMFLHYGDLSDTASLVRLLHEVRPDELYNLGAQSHVRVSFDVPAYTADITGLGVLRILDAVRMTGLDCRVYQASSSEMFGATPPPQHESSPFHPRSPYGCAKVFGYWSAVNYREAWGLHVVNGILFNHESPRRGENFVTRKITRAVARIEAGLQDQLYLGNLDAVRDWGYAPEYVHAMWLALQQNRPDDYVVATGEAHTVREFVTAAFAHVGLDWEKYVVTDDPAYLRPAEVDSLIGNAEKAHRVLGWSPETLFPDLVRIMVDADRQLLEDERMGRLVRVDR